VSDVFDLPVWQKTTGVPPSLNPGGRIGRGLPDVAGNADGQTGYMIRFERNYRPAIRSHANGSCRFPLA
jgi:kumamolisin